ncbi:hypothetical protein P154DRAFT_494192 [Amniculicola lignicola CBS 123094]|uniref:Gag1-like clamp domain-containing protein n=1 Tax=Amniculicola lignicola CBS 123094 TaxID=1392246 RepID=A0A6A5WJ29_9PLEO|nr:hypothetical protein P154DRAFT_494192 [Amniculicola lignicola CBS 123094]
MENNQSAARAARRFLTDRVRSDWEWPNTPECLSASDEELRDVGEFRERYFGTTTPEPESDEEAASAANPYKFDSPDSIATALESKTESRKRKRRTALQEEITWNEGMKLFLARRDAWTGAAAVAKYGTQRRERTGSADGNGTDGDHAAAQVDVEPLIPVAPHLLPDNAIRKSISAKTYPDIYSKIVVSSRTPSVPINLADMTKALVQGWKDSGEWPPKAGPLDPLVGRKKAAVVGLKLEHGEEPFLAHHPHMKKGVDSVRRILHLDGHHHEHDAVGNHVGNHG